MADDADDEAELLAALNAFDVAAGGSSSDSDDDIAPDIDTSAVSRILAGRHSADLSGFSALADALQSVASADIAAVYQSEVNYELQVCVSSSSLPFALIIFAQNARSVRVAALEASLSDCKALIFSVPHCVERAFDPPCDIAPDNAASASALQRLHECAAQKEASRLRTVEREKQRLLRGQQLQQQQQVAQERALDIQKRQAELADAAAQKRDAEDKQRLEMERWLAEQSAAAAAAAAAAEARERQELEKLKEVRLVLQEKLQHMADAEQHRVETRQQAQELQSALIDDLRAAARAAAAEKSAARTAVAAALICLAARGHYLKARPASIIISVALAAAVARRVYARRRSAAVASMCVVKRRLLRARYILLLISHWNAMRPPAIMPASNVSFIGPPPPCFASARILES
jgi:hypothetical protein